jgi:hypothetical protein
VSTKASWDDKGKSADGSEDVTTLRNGWNVLAAFALLGAMAVARAYTTDPGVVSHVLGWAAFGCFLVCLVRLPFVRAQLRGRTVRQINMFGCHDWQPVSARTLEGGNSFTGGTTWVVGLLLETGEVRELSGEMVYGRADVPARKLEKFCHRINTAVGADPQVHWPETDSAD